MPSEALWPYGTDRQRTQLQETGYTEGEWSVAGLVAMATDLGLDPVELTIVGAVHTPSSEGP